MLIELRQLQNQFTTSQAFDFYSSIVDSLVCYLNKYEGFKLRMETEGENEMAREAFLQMPLNIQHRKLKAFSKYYEHCASLVSAGKSLRDKGESLKVFAFLYGLKFPCEDEIYDLLEGDVYVEIYDRELLQIYRSPSWLETTSYGLKTLETSDWRNLFSRSEEILESQMQVVTAIYKGHVKHPIYKPVQKHTVKELKNRSPYCCEVESLIYSPVYNMEDEFLGGLHLLKILNLRKLDYQVYTEIVD